MMIILILLVDLKFQVQIILEIKHLIINELLDEDLKLNYQMKMMYLLYHLLLLKVNKNEIVKLVVMLDLYQLHKMIGIILFVQIHNYFHLKKKMKKKKCNQDKLIFLNL